MGTDKNEAVIEYLMQCPAIQANPLFFNFANVESGSNHFITESDRVKKHYIDGSCLKQYNFTIASYHSISHNAIVGTSSFNDENIENMAVVQDILNWIDEKAENHEYPDFGDLCTIDSMETLAVDPDLDGVDTSVNPPIARYSIGVKIQYIDNKKKLWK